MSTIERALEKQRELEEKKRLQEQESSVDAQGVAQETIHAPVAEVAARVKPAVEDTVSAGREENSPERQQNACHISISNLEQQGMVTPTQDFTPIKEEYRYIKRPLLSNAFDPPRDSRLPSNLIMVSSSNSGEGKTFTSINLAISMALEHDRTVLLVDADVINSSLCKRLAISNRYPGLMDYLSGKATVADIILNTNIPKLKLITAGTRQHHSSEMLASDKMQNFMEELSSRYGDRVVIFDSAPLLGASESNILAQLTGQAVLVVEEGRTTHAQLEQAIRLLNPEMYVGLVLNKSKTGSKDYYGYYYASSK